MNAVHQRLTYLEASFDVVEDLVSRHASELATHNNRIISLETRVAAIEAFMAAMAEKAPTEREPIPKIPELRPGFVIPEFDPRLPLKEDKKTHDPGPVDAVPDPIAHTHTNEEEKLTPIIVHDLAPKVHIPHLGPLTNINEKDNNGDNNI